MKISSTKKGDFFVMLLIYGWIYIKKTFLYGLHFKNIINDVLLYEIVKSSFNYAGMDIFNYKTTFDHFILKIVIVKILHI